MLFRIFVFVFFFSIISRGQEIAGFKGMEPGYKVKDGTTVTVDMPKVRSQDGIGACSEFAAAAVLDATTCQLNGISPCANISNLPNAQVSTLDLARYNKTLKDKDLRYSRGNYKGLIINAGDGGRVLENVLGTGKSVTEACVSFIERVHNFDSSEKVEEYRLQVWEKLKMSYKNLDLNCEKCVSDFTATAQSELQENFNWKRDNLTDLKVFAADSYELFLDQLLVPRSKECAKDPSKMIRFPQSLDIETYPTEKENYRQLANKSKEALISNKLKEVLKSKPVIVSGLCVDSKISTPDKCQNSHDFVISGHREVCNSEGKCKMMVQVHNSWGQDWQDRNDNGWSDAEEIFKRTFYREQSLTWVKMPEGMTEKVQIPEDPTVASSKGF